MMDLTLVFTRLSNDATQVLVQTNKWSGPSKFPFDRTVTPDSIEAQVEAAKQFYSPDHHDYLGWTILPVKGQWDIAHVFQKK